MKKLKNSPLFFGILIISFIIISYLVFAWTEPSLAPPEGNVPAPINTSINAQAKEGALVVGNNSSVTTGLIVRYGNVGIGTTAPGAKLDIQGGWVRIGDVTSNAIQFETQSGFHRVAFRNLRFWDWDTGGDMVTFNNGNVGIGTTAPLSKLGVVGGIIYTGDTNTPFGAQISGDDAGRALFGSNLYLSGANDLRTFGTHDSYGYSGVEATWGTLKFYTASGATTKDAVVTPTPRMTIDTSGNVGIGTTGPATKLEVQGGALCVRSGTQVSCNTTSGAVSAQYFYYISDLRLKTNIQPIENALSRLLTLDGISYETTYDGSRSLGLIAQEVEKVFPEVVNTDKETGLKWIDYGKLVPVLIQAIKEQQKEIEKLKLEIELLKDL